MLLRVVLSEQEFALSRLQPPKHPKTPNTLRYSDLMLDRAAAAFGAKQGPVLAGRLAEDTATGSWGLGFRILDLDRIQGLGFD